MSNDLENDYKDDASPGAKYEAKQLFQEAYQAQLAENYEQAIDLYKRSIETYPTAEAHTFLGWVYSFQDRYDEAIEECLEAIRVDEFKRALYAPRYESYAFPHFNLGRIYETRKKYLDAAKHYGKALEQQPGFTEAASGLHRMQALLN
jgi:tetratricopeptide (TPR) repeat protein